MRFSGLDRKLVQGILVLFLVPTLLAGLVLGALYARGVFEDDPRAVTVAVAVGFVTMMVYLALVAHGLGRSLVRTLQEIQLGTELMATVNPDHRLAVRTGDEMELLALEINRMADATRAARHGLEHEVAGATHALQLERARLSGVLAALGEGVVVATPGGQVVLANEPARTLLGAEAGLVGRSLWDLVDREKVLHFLDRLRGPSGGVERFSLSPAVGVVIAAVMTALRDGEHTTGLVLVLRDVSQPARVEAQRQQAVSETLRDLRGPVASVRSLSESLLGGGDLGAATPLVQAIHAEAVRLSGLVGGRGPAAGLGARRAPQHFERLAARDVVGMTLRRLALERGEGARVEVDAITEDLPLLRVEASALSSAGARLLRALLDRSAQAVGLRLRRRGGILQIEMAAAGTAGVEALEAVLDVPVGSGGGAHGTVRDVVHEHAGEVWGFAQAERFGFRLTFPLEDAGAPGGTPEPGALRRASFVGAGLVSGFGAPEPWGGRPEFYDFSLLDQMERALAPAERERDLATLTYVVVDLETTGLAPADGDRIVSIAGVRVREGTVRRGEAFDALVNPGRPIPASSARFHGITDAMVAEAPPIGVVLPAFLGFVEDAVLVGHQVSFDLAFLERAAAGLGVPSPGRTHAVLDTLLLSEVVHGRLEGHGLDTVAERLGVPARGRHSALGDSLTTAEVFVRLLELLRRRGIVTLGQALAAARRVRGPAPA